MVGFGGGGEIGLFFMRGLVVGMGCWVGIWGSCAGLGRGLLSVFGWELVGWWSWCCRAGFWGGGELGSWGCGGGEGWSCSPGDSS
ncbi:MAG: hypothetical protein FWD57_08600 [Polyangiaceae bacterium]|nr:hypothetical protein [Polyangiaceae bacterium]